MTEPFVPTGREFDDGLGPAHKRRGLGRVVDRLRRKHRLDAPSKIRDFQLTLNPAVGQRESRRLRKVDQGREAMINRPVVATRDSVNSVEIAGETDVPPTVPAPRQVARTRGSSSVPSQGVTEKSTKHRRKVVPPVSATHELEATVPGGALTLVGWVAANNTTTATKPVLDYLAAVLARDLAEAPTTELLNWRLAAHRVSRTNVMQATRAACACEGIPDAVGLVLSRIAEMDTPVLATYHRAVELEAERAAALRAVRRQARDYVSLKPIVAALEKRDPERAGRLVGDLPGGHYSAAINAARSDVARAIAATRDVSLAGDAPQFVPEPGWLPDSSAAPQRLCAAGLVAPMLTDRDRAKVLRVLADGVQAGLDALDSDCRTEAIASLARLGAPVTVQSSAAHSVRRRVSLLETRPATRSPSGASAPTRSGGPRCRKCGVGKPSVGGVCVSCADMRD